MKIYNTIARYMAMGAILLGSVACTDNYMDYNKILMNRIWKRCCRMIICSVRFS